MLPESAQPKYFYVIVTRNEIRKTLFSRVKMSAQSGLKNEHSDSLTSIQLLRRDSYMII